MSPPALGPATGDSDFIAQIEPLLRAAGVRDRVSAIRLHDGPPVCAHFGAGPDTVYEIGSITKTMTSLLFAEAVEAGRVRRDTSLGSVFDLAGSHAGGVTLEELASHRSGLPRVATRTADRVHALLAVTRHRSPYTADVAALIRQAATAKIVRRGVFSYSNLGAALLGQALAARTGTGFPELLERHLFRPLEMTRTTTPLGPRDLPAEAATGWSARGAKEQAWTMNAYAPAGGVRSTPADMTRYAQALLDGRVPGLAALDPRWDADNGTRIG